MKKNKLTFWLVYFLGMILFSLFSGMIIKYFQTGNALDPTVLVSFFVIFTSSSGIGFLVILTLNRAGKYNQSQINKLILPALILFYAAAFLIANLAVIIGVFGWYMYTGQDFSGFWTQLFQHDLIFANGSLFKWLLFFTIAFFFVLWQKSSRKEQKLLEENLKYRYNTLKSQVNPHFLFNSLNTLSELVYIDAKKSDNYIQTLSGIYRYVLENAEKDLIDLEEEIEFVKKYFSLQEVRDEGKIQLEIDIDNEQSGGIKIIPVSLQILVENALKHNAISREKPLSIKMYLKDDCIIVSNALQKKSILESSTQIGLSNLKDRTKILMNGELEINSDASSFIVKLPIQRQK
jgi:two-component system, LytTR family, sensor kinase